MLSLKNKKFPTELINHHTKAQNVALLAFRAILINHPRKNIIEQICLEDIKTTLDLFIFDVQSIYEVLFENMEYLLNSLQNVPNELDHMITNYHRKKLLNIEDYMKAQNVALLALSTVLNREINGIFDVDNKEDMEIAVDSLIYNLESIEEIMAESMGYLWDIRDKIATKKREHDKPQHFSFKQTIA